MHINDAEIRTYLDGEIDPVERERVRSHLADCPVCQNKQRTLEETQSLISGRFASLKPGMSESASPVAIARARLSVMIIEKEKEKMSKAWYVRFRPALIAAVIVLILAAAMAFPQVRAIANGFLGLFRVERVQIVEVDPGNLPEQLGSSYQLEYLLSNNVNFEEFGESQPVSSAVEASTMAGIPVRLPEDITGEMALEVTSEARISFTVELAQIQALLEEIGRGDINLPAEIDGAVVTVDLPPMVVANYGECEVNGDVYPEGYDPDDPSTTRTPACTTLLQMSSPQVTAPESLDLAQLGEAYLQILGMQQSEAAHFSQNIDWASTLVIPIPIYGASYQDLPVDGTTGTLLLTDESNGPLQYMLMWIRDEIIYALTGPGNATTALEIADTLR